MSADVLFLPSSEVERFLPMEEAVDVVESSLAAFARGEAVQPLRRAVWRPDRAGLLGLMPGMLLGETSGDAGTPGVMGVKVVTVFLGSHGPDGPPSHQGLVLLFDADDGTPRAILDAASVTAIRTAAASAVATRHMAREESSILAILGSGVQAASHVEALRAVRPVERVRVWSRSTDNARRFAAEQSEIHDLPVEAFPTVRDALDGADLICTVTSSPEPVLQGAWLAPGVHVNAVGACTPKARELDAEAVARSRVVVDAMESALNEAGDFLLAREEGVVDDEHLLGELGDVILGQLAGRTSEDEITLFESLGLAVEDLAAAVHVLKAAQAAGAGTRLTL